MNDMTHVEGGVHANNGGFLRRMSVMLQRAGMGGLLGQVFGGKRDYWEVFGYPRILNPQHIWEMYHRGGIAKRIAHAYPDATWGRPPQLYVKDNPEWNAQWDKLVKKWKLWDVIKKADIMAGLGRYAVVLVGTTSPNMEAPLRKGRSITYLQPYSEANVKVSEWVRDPTDPRFGQPLYYMVSPNKNKSMLSQENSFAPVAQSFRVHYSRIWHIAHGTLESPVYGIPRYAPIWNYLMDLIKVVGSSAESYWMTAYQGIHADVDAEMEMDEEDADDLSDEIDEFQHGLRRFIRTRGVSIKSLGSKVADPRGAFDVVLTLIAGTTGIPKRILLGSEAGQLASSQDKAAWAERIEEERTNYAEPAIIGPIVKWLLDYGMLDEVEPEDITLLWPDAYRMSPLERGQTAAQTARTATNLQKAMAPTVIKKGQPELRDDVGNVIQEATEDETDEPLLSRDEARKIIGLSTDMQALIESPD